MIKKIDKNKERLRRHLRVRKKISGTAEAPRFSVYRSLNHIYVQIIDDEKGVTLCSASTMEKDVKAEIGEKTKTEAAKLVGKKAALKKLCSTGAATSIRVACRLSQTAQEKPDLSFKERNNGRKERKTCKKKRQKKTAGRRRVD